MPPGGTPDVDDESPEDREWRLENEAANAIRDFTPVQAANRLHQLQNSAHLSDRQRAGKAKLEGWVAASAAVLADGGFFDSRRMEGVGHPSSTAAPNRRPGQTIQRAPVGRFTNQAHRVLDALHGRGLPDHAATVADGLIRHPAGAGDQVNAARDLAARWLSVCGSPAYESAFARILADPADGWGDLGRSRAAKPGGPPGRSRAALGESGTGGYPGADHSRPGNSFVECGEQITRCGRSPGWRQITTDPLAQRHMQPGGQRRWSAEGAEAARREPRAGTAQACRCTKWIAFVPFSLELEGDVPELVAQLSSVLVNAADLLRQEPHSPRGSGVGHNPAGFIPNVTPARLALPGLSPPMASTLAQNSLAATIQRQCKAGWRISPS